MHSQFEPYLQQVETRLADLPPAQRESEVEEMRQHLEAMVEARVEMGMGETQAIAQTLEQFGQAQSISRELARVHGRSRKFLPDNLLTATLCAAVCTYGGAALLCLALLLLERNGIHLFTPKGDFYRARVAFTLTVCVSSGLVAGAMTGALFPRRAVVGIGAIFLIWCSMGISQISSYHSMTAPEVLQVCGFWTVAAAIVMIGAKAGAHRRKRRLHRKRLAA